MSQKRRPKTTKIQIIQVATRMFLERGYTDTSIKAISDQLGISTGNLTFYFPTKEHLLAVLVEMLCDFQWKLMERNVDEGNSSLMAMCLELPAMAAICEENDVARDFYLSAYRSVMSLDIIRQNDTLKAKRVMGPYCPGWSHGDFVEAEILLSGIEYATLMTTSQSPPLHERIAGALEAILTIFHVPAGIRTPMIQKVLSMDHRAIGRQILQEFMGYIERTNEQVLEDLLRS